MNGEPVRVLLVEGNEDNTVGGSHQCLFDLVVRIDQRAWLPCVIFYQDNRFVSAIAARGVDAIVWTQERGLETRCRWGNPVLRKFDSLVRLAGAIARRVRFLRRNRIELVHLNNSPGLGFDDWLPAARLTGIPIVAHARGPSPGPGGRRASFVTRHFDRVVAISDYIAETFVASGLARDKIRRIYDGIDLARWNVVADPSLCSGGDAMVEAVMIGHLRAWKGQDVVLTALALLPSSVRRRLRVRFIGEAPSSDRTYAEALKEQVRFHALADCVEFLGYVADPRPLVERADILIHASTLPEPFGLVVVEGMALGKAVIASNRGGPAEIVTEGTGLLFNPREPRQLAVHLTNLVGDPELRRSLGWAARKRAQEFSVERTAAEVQSLWREIMDARRSTI